MSQYGILRAFLVNGRVASNPLYFPPHVKNGREVSAKALVTVMVNRRPFVDRDSNEVRERKPVILQIGGWAGVADAIARGAKQGQVVSCELDVESFDSVVKIPQKQGDAVLYVPVMKPDGSGHFTETKIGFSIVPGSLRFGEDSAKCIDEEIVKGERPIGWNKQIPIAALETALAQGNLNDLLAQAKQGKDTWNAILKAKNSQQYQGGKTFGNAKVVRPAGDIVLKYPLDVEVNDAVNKTKATVDGFTYEDMLAAGWTDEQLLTADNGKWASLVPKKAPAPPAPPAPKKAPTPPAPKMNAVAEAAAERQAILDAMNDETFESDMGV